MTCPVLSQIHSFLSLSYWRERERVKKTEIFSPMYKLLKFMVPMCCILEVIVFLLEGNVGADGRGSRRTEDCW